MQNQINAQIAAINNTNQTNDYLAMQQLNSIVANDQTNLEIQQLNDQLAALNCGTSIVDNNNQVFTSDLFTENIDLNMNMNVDVSDTFGGGMAGMDLSQL